MESVLRPQVGISGGSVEPNQDICPKILIQGPRGIAYTIVGELRTYRWYDLRHPYGVPPRRQSHLLVEELRSVFDPRRRYVRAGGK